MTKKEAYKFMVDNPDVKIRHDYYSDNEYIFMNENEEIITEEGYNMGDHTGEFWSKYQIFEDGWEVVEQ